MHDRHPRSATAACLEGSRIQEQRQSQPDPRRRPTDLPRCLRHPISHAAGRRRSECLVMVCHPTANDSSLAHGSPPSVVISLFAIVILSVIGILFKSNHHSVMGSTDDPRDGPAVAATVFSAVAVYGVCVSLLPLLSKHRNPLPLLSPSRGGLAIEVLTVDSSVPFSAIQAFLIFCGFQAWLNVRENRRGAIVLT